MGTSVLLGRAGTCSGEAAALCPAAQAIQSRGVPVACAKTKAFQSKSPCNLPSGLPTCATGNWKWKLPEKCVHVLSAYLGSQVLPSGSANLLSQPVIISEVLQPSEYLHGLLCPSYTGNSRTGHRTPGGVSGGQRRGDDPLP